MTTVVSAGRPRARAPLDEIVGFNQRRRDAWVAQVAAGLPPRTRVLDVGCGEARYRTLFSHCDYRTHDFGAYAGTQAGLLREAWAYAPLDYCSDITAIAAPDGAFDAILCTEVLEHVPEPIEALRECARLLRAGGRLFVTAPLGSGLHQQPYHYYGGFTPHFYQRFLPRFGMRIARIEANGGLFRLVLQELNRARHIIQSHKRYARRHPLRWLLNRVMGEWTMRWFARLDDEIPVSEFTVGYHVEAVKEGGA